eukprot:637168-Rhodomonas_salina.2
MNESTKKGARQERKKERKKDEPDLGLGEEGSLHVRVRQQLDLFPVQVRPVAAKLKAFSDLVSTLCTSNAFDFALAERALDVSQ